MNPSLQLTQFLASTIRELAATESEPFYLYESATIRRICQALQAIPYPHKSVHFATQANINEQFLGIIREEGMGIFVNSALHLQHAISCGFSENAIVFTASAMNAETMQQVHAAGAHVNLDSLGQINRWQTLYPGTPFGIRCNIGALVRPRSTGGAFYIGKESRLGLSPEEILSLAGNRSVNTLHLYAGTDLNSIDYFRECYQALCSFSGHFPALEYLNFGGGFSMENESGGEFDFSAYGAMVSEVMERASMATGRLLRLQLEPGRIVGGKAGYFVCRVIDVKIIDGRQFIGVNASTAQFPRPLFHCESAWHPVALLPDIASHADGDSYPSTIYGCSTYSRDYLASEAILPQVHADDLIVLGEAGSYSASSYTLFLGFPPAKERFI